MNITSRIFGKLPDGRKVVAYTIENTMGASVTLLNYGGIIQSLVMPDREGNMKDIVCGYDNIESYLTASGYQGALIGRYGNRIGKAKFSLDGKEYHLYVNSGKEDTLHGGKEGFNTKIWDAITFENETGAGVRFSYVSPDGEEGYPGELHVEVTYAFTEDNRLILSYMAGTDKPTVCNLTNHVYFNLGGVDGPSVMDHEMWLNSEYYTPVDENLIPTAEGFAPVEGTIFDFRELKPIENPLDHNFKLRANGMIRRAAFLCERTEGRSLTVYTNMPDIQIYTGCVMNGPEPFKGGVPQRPLHAVCFETQYAPDTPNRPDFASCVLRPGEIYDFTTVFEFDTVL